MQITNDEFARILLKLSRKIVNIKGLEINLPENLANDLNSKYRECQKLVDFLKKIGYKSDLNINNVLFPTIRDMSRIFEFSLEYLTIIDTGMTEYGQNFSESNYAKLKISKVLTNWMKSPWIVPEVKTQTRTKGKDLMLKYDTSRIMSYKKLIANNPLIPQDQSNLIFLKKFSLIIQEEN